jgi:hypothetical protein
MLVNAKKPLFVFATTLQRFLASYSPDGALKLIRYLNAKKTAALDWSRTAAAFG